MSKKKKERVYGGKFKGQDVYFEFGDPNDSEFIKHWNKLHKDPEFQKKLKEIKEKYGYE